MRVVLDRYLIGSDPILFADFGGSHSGMRHSDIPDSKQTPTITNTDW